MELIHASDGRLFRTSSQPRWIITGSSAQKSTHVGFRANDQSKLWVVCRGWQHISLCHGLSNRARLPYPVQLLWVLDRQRAGLIQSFSLNVLSPWKFGYVERNMVRVTRSHSSLVPLLHGHTTWTESRRHQRVLWCYLCVLFLRDRCWLRSAHWQVTASWRLWCWHVGLWMTLWRGDVDWT